MDVPPPTRPPPRRPDAPETTPPNARPLPSPQGRPLPTPGTPVGSRPLPTPGDPSLTRPLPNPQGRPLPTPGTQPVGNRPLPAPGANQQRPLPTTNGVPPMRGGIPRGRGGSVRMPREGSQPILEQPTAPPKGGSFRMPRGGSQPSIQTPISPPPSTEEEDDEVFFEDEISKPPLQPPPKPPAKQPSQTTIEQTPPTIPVRQQSQPQIPPQPQPVLTTKPQEPQKASSISQRIQSFKTNNQSSSETSNTNLRSPSTPKLPDRSPENARKKSVVKGPPCPWREPLADESPKQPPPIVSPRNNLPPSLPPKQTSSIEISQPPKQSPPIVSPRNNLPPSLSPKQYPSSSSLDLPPRSPEGSRRSNFIQGPDLPWREPLPQANNNNNINNNNIQNNNNAPPVAAQNKPQRQPTLGQQMSNLFSQKPVESNPPLENVPSIDLTRMKFGLSDEDIKKPPKEQLSILSNQINTINQKIQDLLKERRRIESTHQNQNLVKDIAELENYYDAENIRICNQITAIQKIFEADIAKLSDPNLENTPKPPMNRRGSILVAPGEQSTFVICTQEYIPWHTDQLSIKNGDIIKVLQKFPTSWWKGELNKVVGFFPLNHTQPFSQSAPVFVQNSIQRPVETPSSSSSNHEDKKAAPTLTEFLTSPRKDDPQPQPPSQPQPQPKPQPQIQVQPQPQIQIQPQPQVQVQIQQPAQTQPQPQPQPRQQSSQTPLQLPAYAQSRPQSQQQIPIPVQSKPTPPQPSNPAPQPAGEYVIALYDIPQPSYPNQLTLKKGDIIRLIDNSDQTWWKGELNGKEGFIPSTFVQPYSYSNPPPVPAPVGVQRAKVLYSYSGRSESEATVTVGSIVQVEKIEGPWTLVNTNGESGFIPSSYLELL